MVRILLTHPHRLYPPLSSSCHVNSWSTSADTTVNSVQAVSLSPYWPVRCISHRALLFRLFNVFECHNSLQSMMATPSGFEPELCESKSHVLPLHQGAMYKPHGCYSYSHSQFLKILHIFSHCYNNCCECDFMVLI